MKADVVVVRGESIPSQFLERNWKCGLCGSNLIARAYFDPVFEMRTVCSGDDSHPADSFIPRSVGKDRKKEYQFWFKMKGAQRMGFVKDRHNENGQLMDASRVRRSGRISLGEKRERGGARALPFFTFKAYDDGPAGEAILQQVYAAIEKYAPGQEDPERPTVLPIYFPASDVTTFASSEYKLPGKEGRARCVGDGEVINFKLGNFNLMEINDDKVLIDNLVIDGEKMERGISVRCPGRSENNRWEHCEKCRLALNIDLQIAGLPYIFQLTTGDKVFYDQFFTVIATSYDYIRQGLVHFLPEVPFLLRREEGTRARPDKKADGVHLVWQEMPTLSIEVHPLWKMQVGASRALPSGEVEQQLQIEAGPPPTWYELAKIGLPGRPWGPEDVGTFVTKAMREYSVENEDAHDDAPPPTLHATKKIMVDIFTKLFDGDDRAISLVAWYLFGGKEVRTYAQCAAIYRWAKDDFEGEGRKGTVPNPHFEQELLTVLDAANAEADNVEEGEFHEEEEPPF